MPGTQKVTKSSSLGSMKGGPTTPLIMDQDDIIALTQNVKNFSDALAKLKTTFTEKIENGDEAKVATHERLGEVLCILKNVLQGYPALHSTDLFSSAAALITKIKGYDYGSQFTSEDVHTFCDAIDQLALAFSSSVSQYLMGDVMPEMFSDGKTKSYDNLTKIGKEPSIESTYRNTVNDGSGRQLTAEDIDLTLVHLEAGLDLALQRAKAWSKYARDIMTYIEKKAQLESEYSRSLSKLIQSTRQSLSDEGFLPLQSVYCTVLTQDMEYASNCQTTHTLLQTSKFVEPLASRRAEHDKVRKSVKESWMREIKKMHDTVTNLRKAQALYVNRQQEFERAKEAYSKADSDKQEKRKKTEDDALHKAAEAETTYKACVAESNYRHKELEKNKAELLAKVREQIELCDQVMKTVTVEYFQLLHAVSAPLPVQYHTLCETSKTYEVGSQFAEYVRRLPVNNNKNELFVFQPYKPGLKENETRKTSTQSNGSGTSDHVASNEASPTASPKKDKYRIPVKAWGQNLFLSDTDSASGGSNKSHDSSPCNSPRSVLRRQLASSQSLEELTEEDAFTGNECDRQLKRTMTVGDEVLDVPGILKHQKGRRNTTFGVDFQEQVNILNVEIPPIVTRCLAEVEKRGMEVKGLYRVSGVKSKVENLCQRFELDASTVALDDIHPNVLSSVLKQYLRHLPEPLMTFRLYPDFVHTAKGVMEGSNTHQQGVERFKSIVLRLPISNLKTCAVLMHHLQRVASHSDQNQMSAANLGIVFGPTLLKPYEGMASLASLVDTPHQTLAIEMLISSAQTIFGPADNYQIIHAETPVEQIPDIKSSDKHGDASTKRGEESKRDDITTQSQSSENMGGDDSSIVASQMEDKKCEGEFSLPGSTSNEIFHSSSLSSTTFLKEVSALKSPQTSCIKPNYSEYSGTTTTPPTITLTTSGQPDTTILHKTLPPTSVQPDTTILHKMSTRTSKTSLATPWSESAKTNITGYPSTTCSRSDVTKNRPATRKTPLIDTSSLTGTLSPTPSLVSPICLAKQSTSGQNITGKSTDFESKPTKSLATLSKSTAIRTVPSDTDSPKPGLNVTPSTSAKIQHYSGEGCSPSSTVTKPSSKTEKKNSSMSVTPRKSNDKNDANSDRTPRFV